MQLLDIPHELFLELWDIFETQETYAQMNALIQTCHYLYDNFNPRLYHNVAHTDSSNAMAMTWAIRHGPITTTEKLLDAGDRGMEGLHRPNQAVTGEGRRSNG